MKKFTDSLLAGITKDLKYLSEARKLIICDESSDGIPKISYVNSKNIKNKKKKLMEARTLKE